MANYFMGIDIGTYESKGVLIDGHGQVVTRAARPHTMETPRPGWAEHDAEATWWDDLCALSHTLIDRSGARPAEVGALGVSAIAPCCLPVDEAYKPLRKGMLYGVDVRAAEEIALLTRQIGTERVLNLCGMPLTSQSAAAKVKWLERNEPEVYARSRWFLTASSYLVARLTGRPTIDRYTAAAWAPLYDLKRQDWSDETFDICNRDRLAECLWTDEVAGRLTADAARVTGLSEGTPVTTGTADAAAEAVGAGVLSPGDMLVMYGSSIFMIQVTERLERDARLWTGPYLFPGTHALTAGMSCAGTLTRWFRDQLAPDVVECAAQSGENAYQLLAALCEGIPAGSDGLIALPYFSGERTPINDPSAKGVFFGLNLTHTRAHLYNALLEGVALGIAQHVGILRTLGVPVRRAMAVGGGVKNRRWLQMSSDAANLIQCVPGQEGGAAYGDALLAALAVGHFRDRAEMAGALGEFHEVTPHPVNVEAYGPIADRFRRLYEATRELMHEF